MKRWLYWLICLALAIGAFAYGESEAFLHPDQYDTLSHVVSTIAHDWPLSIFIMGNFTGGLSVHFFWAWKKNPMGDGGG